MKKFTTKRLAIITSDALNEILDAKYSGITQVVNAQEILANPLIGALREEGLTAGEAKNTAKELIEALGRRARCKSYNEALEEIVAERNETMLGMYNKGEVPILVEITIAVPSIKGAVLVGPFRCADYSLLPIVVTTSQPSVRKTRSRA